MQSTWLLITNTIVGMILQAVDDQIYARYTLGRPATYDDSGYPSVSLKRLVGKSPNQMEVASWETYLTMTWEFSIGRFDQGYGREALRGDPGSVTNRYIYIYTQCYNNDIIVIVIIDRNNNIVIYNIMYI